MIENGRNLGRLQRGCVAHDGNPHFIEDRHQISRIEAEISCQFGYAHGVTLLHYVRARYLFTIAALETGVERPKTLL